MSECGRVRKSNLFPMSEQQQQIKNISQNGKVFTFVITLPTTKRFCL